MLITQLVLKGEKNEGLIETEEPMKMIYVYKTSVKNKKDLKRISPILNASLNYSNWSIDLEDCDNILRVECEKNDANKIITLLKSLGFDCEELLD